MLKSCDFCCTVTGKPAESDGYIAQMVERTLRMREVQGSIPCVSIVSRVVLPVYQLYPELFCDASRRKTGLHALLLHSSDAHHPPAAPCQRSLHFARAMRAPQPLSRDDLTRHATLRRPGARALRARSSPACHRTAAFGGARASRARGMQTMLHHHGSCAVLPPHQTAGGARASPTQCAPDQLPHPAAAAPPTHRAQLSPPPPPRSKPGRARSARARHQRASPPRLGVRGARAPRAHGIKAAPLTTSTNRQCTLHIQAGTTHSRRLAIAPPPQRQHAAPAMGGARAPRAHDIKAAPIHSMVRCAPNLLTISLTSPKHQPHPPPHPPPLPPSLLPPPLHLSFPSS